MRITLISVWPCGMACGANSGAALSKLDAKACVTVSAILVDHAPIFPVFAFRFDTPAGAVVISGDTNRNANLIELAKGADILIHEAIDLDWARSLFPAQRTPAQDAKLRHLLEAHTGAHDLGSIAGAPLRR
jgi:ribonuclease BN (tRNA processing enzyme)